MAQYDSKAERWIEMKRNGKNVAHEYLEKPAMDLKLSDLSGKTVYALGCGSGEELSILTKHGARNIIGSDNSAPLIESAKKLYPKFRFFVADMEDTGEIESESIDFVYSSLVMHYKADWTKTLMSLHKIMKPGAKFLFSTHHPVRWSAETLKNQKHNQRILGYDKLPGNKLKIYGDYLNRSERHDIWFGDFDVKYYHKPLGEILTEIRECNFEIVDFIEPRPVPDFKVHDPKGYKVNMKIPMFMIFELMKK